MTGTTPDAPTISVLIPTRNGGRLLLEALDSVFAQTYQPLEIIVVDDGSDDDTAARLAPLEDAGRVVVIRQPGGGTAHARNTALAAARGSLVALLDHDDRWPADKLAWQVQALAACPEAVLVYGYMESFGLERPYRWPGPAGHGDDAALAFRRKNWIRSPGQTLMRTAAVRAAGGFDAALAGADDWDLYLKLAATGPFHYVDRLALAYRVHGANQSKRAWTLFRQACRVHGRHAGTRPPRRPTACLRWLLCRATLVHMLMRDITARRPAGRRAWPAWSSPS